MKKHIGSVASSKRRGRGFIKIGLIVASTCIVALVASIAVAIWKFIGTNSDGGRDDTSESIGDTTSVFADGGIISLKDIATNEELNTDDVWTLWLQDEPYHFLIDIYPGVALDVTASYKIDGIEGYDGNAELVHVEYEDDSVTNEYMIVPKKPGSVRMIIYVNGDVNVAKAITLHIKSNIMDSMKVLTEDFQEVGDSLVLSKPTKLFCEASPIESLYDVKWESDNSDCVAITDEGKLWPMAAGKTFITVTAISKSGGEITKEITIDTSEMLVRSAAVSTTKSDVDVDWVKSYVLMVKEAEVVEIGENVFEVSHKGATATVTVTCGVEEGWHIAGDIPNTIYSNRRPTILECEYNDFEEHLENNGELGVSFGIMGDTESAELSENILTALKAGTITLVATDGNGVSHEKEIIVKECPLAFDLNLNKEDYEVGLARERVWGIWFKNERDELVNTYQFGSSIDESKTEVLWEISDESVSISPERVLSFAPEAAGKSVTVTAIVMAGTERTNTKRSFTFNFTSDPDSINIYNTEQFNEFHQTGRDIVLQPSIDPATGEKMTLRGDKAYHINCSIYGNGVAFDCTMFSHNNVTIINVYPQMCDYDEDKIITISNLEMYGANTFEKSNGCGEGIGIRGNYNTVNIEYCRLHNFHIGIRTRHRPDVNDPIMGDINITGCYISDCYLCGVMLSEDPPISENKIVFSNDVFNHFSGACIFVSDASFDDRIYYENIYPNIVFEGNVEFYNWKSTDELGGLTSAIPDNWLLNLSNHIGIEPGQLKDSIGMVLSHIFEREDMNYLIYKDTKAGKKYVSMGLMALGTYCHSEGEAHTTINDDSLKLLKMDIPTTGGICNIIGIAEGGIQILNTVQGKEAGKGMTITNPCYFVCYDCSNGEPRVMPGDKVPQSEDLYAILHGNA